MNAGHITLEPEDIQELTPAKVIQRRALLECRPGDALVIGFGVPGRLPGVALEEGVFDALTFTVEHGPVGGINPFSRGAKTFCSASSAGNRRRGRPVAPGMPEGASSARSVLGTGEVDLRGNVNVSRFGRRIPGCGGFVDITDSMPSIVFTFALGDRGSRKVIEKVQQVTFSGERAVAKGQQVIYISEKAVFRLTTNGLVLSEIAPGLDPDQLVASLGARIPVSPMSSKCRPSAGVRDG